MFEKMEPLLVSLCTGLAVPDEFRELLVSKKVHTVEDVALLAASEAEIKSEIFPWARSAGVKLKEMSDQLAVKKLWVAARKAYDGGKASAPAVPGTVAAE